MLELLRRDYFRFMLKKHSSKFSQEIPTEGLEKQEQPFSAWRDAKTGVPLVDALINELNTTGYITNQGRQILASYLIKYLDVNWVFGAAFFKEKLIDYSPASNLGNWISLLEEATGTPAKGFDIIKKAQESDPQGEYVRRWVPVLASIPGGLIHQPWKLSAQELKQYGIDDLSVYAALSVA